MTSLVQPRRPQGELRDALEKLNRRYAVAAHELAETKQDLLGMLTIFRPLPYNPSSPQFCLYPSYQNHRSTIQLEAPLPHLRVTMFFGPCIL